MVCIISNNKFISMSTLPSLFVNAESITIRPRKQGGIFAIRKSSHYTAANQSRIKTSCTNRTLRTKHTLSFANQRPYSRQSCLSSTYATLGASFNMSESKVINSQETDNLRAKADQCFKSLRGTPKIIQSLAEDRINLLKDLEILSQKICNEHESIVAEIGQGIKILRKSLSSLRRDSGMEIKVNGIECKELSEQLLMIKNAGLDINKQAAQKTQQYMQ